MPRISRQPLHAGTWYEDDAKQLADNLGKWLADVVPSNDARVRAIISPHAAYRYCGHVAAHAFGHIDPTTMYAGDVHYYCWWHVHLHSKRVFVLGPSHNMYTRKCVLSTATDYTTPLGSIDIDGHMYQQLQATGLFEFMDLDVDEAEHSLEMQIPFLQHIMRGHFFTLVPVMVGVLDADSEAKYGAVFAKYLDDPTNLFVISSDFCHWGQRFDYFFYDASKGPIHESVRWLDHVGMDIIEQGDAAAFRAYLKQYGNTICGRRPISVFLNLSTRFTSYGQSSKATKRSDHSVSYAAAVITQANT